MSLNVVKSYISTPYPHQFNLFVLLANIISGLSFVDAITAATNNSSIISCGSLPMRTRTFRSALEASSSIAFSLFKIVVEFEAASSLVANLTYTTPYFFLRLIEVAFYERAPIHSFIFSSYIISISLACGIPPFYPSYSPLIPPERPVLLHLPPFVRIVHIFVYLPCSPTTTSRSTTERPPLQQP